MKAIGGKSGTHPAASPPPTPFCEESCVGTGSLSADSQPLGQGFTEDTCALVPIAWHNIDKGPCLVSCHSVLTENTANPNSEGLGKIKCPIARVPCHSDKTQESCGCLMPPSLQYRLDPR